MDAGQLFGLIAIVVGLIFIIRPLLFRRKSKDPTPFVLFGGRPISERIMGYLRTLRLDLEYFRHVYPYEQQRLRRIRQRRIKEDRASSPVRTSPEDYKGLLYLCVLVLHPIVNFFLCISIPDFDEPSTFNLLPWFILYIPVLVILVFVMERLKKLSFNLLIVFESFHIFMTLLFSAALMGFGTSA